MNFSKLSFGAVAVLVSIGVFGSNIKPARGEMVYADEAVVEETQENAADAVVAVPAPTVEEEAPKAVVAAEVTKEVSPTELIRRERIRTEMKNEDLVSRKLEELRLADEKKRTEQILGAKAEEKKVEEKKTEEKVVKPAPAAVVVEEQEDAELEQISTKKTSAASTSVLDAEEIDADGKMIKRITITPRFGLSNVVSSVYDIRSNYAAGFTLGLDLNDIFAVETGYTYSNYGLNAGTSVYSPYGYNTAQMQTLTFNDNQIDVGVRANILGIKSQIRPFVGLGGGYRRGFINYDSATAQYLNNYWGSNQDVEISGFNAYASAGAELRITENISITGQFKYYRMLTAQQNQALNPNAFVNQNQGGMYYNGAYYTGNSANYGPYAYNNDVKNRTGDELARAASYNLSIGLTVGF